MNRVIFHLDMDAFFASVEQRDNPALRGVPVIVGALPGQRGVVCTASYEARKFGVGSAMPVSTAERLCPKGVFLRPRMEAYRQESLAVMGVLQGFGGTLEQVSVDEAYLDFSQRFTKEDTSAYLALGREIKDAIQKTRGLAASIGIGANKLVAKIASDCGKPNGLLCISETEKVAFLRPLPASAIHGVGKTTAATLLAAGIRTIGDLQDFEGDLRSLVGSFAAVLQQFAIGQDDRPLDYDGKIQSISTEETFQRNTCDRKILVPLLREQSVEIASKLAKERMGAKTVQVKVRYADFQTVMRQVSVRERFDSAEEIFRIGCYLLRRNRLVNRPLRLLGLGVGGLGEPSGQLYFPF